MSKKMMTIVSSLLFVFTFACFALEPATSEVVVGNVMHTVSLERLSRDPPLFLAVDRISAPGKDLASFCITATFSESRMLKSLVVTVVSDRTFDFSGELEWLFPNGSGTNIYGKTEAKSLKDGMMQHTMTFLSGLGDFCKSCDKVAGQNVLLRMYSKKGRVKELEMPSAFFALLSDPAE